MIYWRKTHVVVAAALSSSSTEEQQNSSNNRTTAKQRAQQQNRTTTTEQPETERVPRNPVLDRIPLLFPILMDGNWSELGGEIDRHQSSGERMEELQKMCQNWYLFFLYVFIVLTNPKRKCKLTQTNIF